jgi:hypothetical protein
LYLKYGILLLKDNTYLQRNKLDHVIVSYTK